MREVASGDEPVRDVVRTAIVFLTSLAAAAGLYKIYGAVFPYSRAPLGVCRHCGKPTALTPAGWSPFCPEHIPLFGLLQTGMILIETIILLVAVVDISQHVDGRPSGASRLGTRDHAQQRR
jgi:hypothetical protein